MKKKLISLLVLLSTFAVAQDDIINQVPPSPNAAHLGKYGEINMNYSAGTPNISIPLYVITEGDLKWPISLDYNYNGFKPMEKSSWVGRGWTLSGGGVITRTVQGLRDETVIKGFLTNGGAAADIGLTAAITCNQQNLVNFYTDALNNNTDTQPDIFHFNFGGYSGKFFFDKNGEAHIVSARKIKIEKEILNYLSENQHEVNGVITKFTLTTEDGSKYVFSEREYSESVSNGSNPNDDNPTAWHISEFVSPNGRKLKFSYTNLYSGVPSNATRRIQLDWIEKGLFPYCPPGNLDCYSGGYTATGLNGLIKTYSEERFLTTIESETGYSKVIFNSEVLSEFVDSETSTTRRLNSLEVRNKSSNEFIQRNELLYDIDDKLMLLNVGDVGALGEKKQPHKFEYIGGRIPYYVSTGLTKSLDAWGYYNGAPNMSLIPEKGAIRLPSFEKAVLGSLNRVTYPTGGTTSFEYEQNEYSFTSDGLVTGPQIVTETFNFLIVEGQGVGNPTISVTQPTSYKIEYGCVYSPYDPPSQGCPAMNTPCSLNNVTTYSSAPLTPGTNYDINTFLTPSQLANQGCVQDLRISAKVTIFKSVGNDKKYGPGVRVKRITTSDNGSNPIAQVRDFTYNDLVTPTKSSGGINREPLFSSVLEFQLYPTSSPNMGFAGYVKYQNNSIVTLGAPNVIYKNVEERVNNTNKVVYQFSSYEPPYHDINSVLKNQPPPYYSSNCIVEINDPIGPSENYDFERGLLLSKRVYKGITNTPVEETEYEYNREVASAKGVIYTNKLTEYKVPSFYNEFLASVPNNTSLPSKIYFNKFYYTVSGVFRKTKETYKIYDMDGLSPMTSVTNYTYETTPKHLQVVKTVSQKSDLSTQETINKYPLDYETVNPKQSFITEMINNNYVTPVVESQTWVNRGGTRTLVNSKLNYYKTIPISSQLGYELSTAPTFPKSNVIALDKVYTFKSVMPLTESVANTSLFNGNSFVSTYYRERIRLNTFDARMNLRDYTLLNSDNITYLWGYKGQYIVAEIKNATVAQLNTGLTTAGSSALEIFNLEDPNILTTKLNSLRAAMPNSLITSFTYRPLIGLAKTTDPSGLINYFEYDNFNRLRDVFDTNYNKIKNYKYVYGDGSLPPPIQD